MNKLLAANWKENPETIKEASRVLSGAKMAFHTEVVVCPPFVYLEKLKAEKPKTKFGTQDVFWENRGAFTGEISPTMLKNLGIEYVIIGHSERRQWLKETDEMINKKVFAALKAGLKIILCVGEPTEIRKKGLNASRNFVKNQLKKDLKDIHSSLFRIYNSLTIAYEPRWAIGMGKSDTPKDALEIIKFIKQFCDSRFALRDLRVLYGGSVNSRNVKNFLQYKEIDGALVGGASLKTEEFRKMITIVDNL